MYHYIIIDDEELIRKGTLKKIEPLSAQVTCVGEAENGKDGIRMIEEKHPDFVILDMQMPIMNGMELLPYLAEQYPALPLIVISGFRDFDYIKQAISSNAIEYLLKPFSKEMIQNCVTEAMKRLESRSQIDLQMEARENEKERACYDYDIQLLNNLILGYHVADTRLTSKRLNFINETHNLLLLTLHFSQIIPESDIQEWLEEHGFSDLALYLSSPGNEHLGFIILFLPIKGTIRNDRLVNQILADFLPWMAEQNTPATAGISKTHSNLSDLSRAYEETSQALNQQLLVPAFTSAYYYTEDIAPHQIIWAKEDELLFRIESGVEKEVAQLTDELFSYYSSVKGCTLNDVKYHCYLLSGQCRRLVNEYLKSPGSKEASNSIQNVVNHLFSLNELKEYFLQFFTNLTSLLRPSSVYAIEDTIEKAKIYMERNYQKNITQDFLSSLLWINRSYLSTLFKERTGEKFVDYLNNIRIRKAKEMLTHSDRKMYQIAKAVGYDNIKYFFRVFKKRTGMTPEQYRKNIETDHKYF